MKKTDKINSSCPSGFPEFLPGEKRLELYLLDTIRKVFESYGFTPIETPAVERLEVLQAKENQGDNIIYGIQPILPPNRQAEKEQAEAEKELAVEASQEARALKFDQTVPLAAYITRHFNELKFPFARYQMDVVFRGERAKDGRYRQFRQCDIDVVARNELSLMYDAQMPAIISEIFEKIDIGKFLIRINNRKILTGFFESIKIAETQIKTCLEIIDRAEKIGLSQVQIEFEKQGLSEEQVRGIIDFTKITGSVDEILNSLKTTAESQNYSAQFRQGVTELETVISGVRNFGVPESNFCIDLSIARGLNYYTSTVYETTLVNNESLGSICSGGRYENLVSVFMGEKMPGVGISIGLTRLISRLLKAGILNPLPATPAQVAIVNLDNSLLSLYLDTAQKLRKVGINVVAEFEKRALGKQLQLADKQGIPLCVIIGSEEAAAQKCSLKNLKTGEQTEVPLIDLAQRVKEICQN